MRATFGWGGAAGRKFVRTAARLGLSKWHAGRAMKGRKMTVSADWIVPLRQELAEQRMAVARSMGRAVPMPQAWTPGQYAPQQQQVPQQPYPQQPPQVPQRQQATQYQTPQPYAQQQQPPLQQQQPQQPAPPYNQYPPPGWGKR
jgi:hypothetical protein